MRHESVPEHSSDGFQKTSSNKVLNLRVLHVASSWCFQVCLNPLQFQPFSVSGFVTTLHKEGSPHNYFPEWKEWRSRVSCVLGFLIIKSVQISCTEISMSLEEDVGVLTTFTLFCVKANNRPYGKSSFNGNELKMKLNSLHWMVLVQKAHFLQLHYKFLDISSSLYRFTNRFN